VRSPPPPFFFLALVRDRPHAAISNEYGYGLSRLSYYSPSFNKDKCMFVHSNLRSILFFMKRIMIDVWQYVDCPRTEENIVIVFYTVSLNKYSHFFLFPIIIWVRRSVNILNFPICLVFIWNSIVVLLPWCNQIYKCMITHILFLSAFF
jgi:hypothetical protein